MSREIMQQALDALDIACANYGDVGGADTHWGKWDAAIDALRAALGAPGSEPVAIVCEPPQTLTITGGAIVRWATPTTTPLPPGTKLYAAASGGEHEPPKGERGVL